jgi:hypothetical protein
MARRRVTNWLLLGIFLALLAQVGLQISATPVLAETFKLDTCITSLPNDRPDSYVHVVTHPPAGD